MTTLRAQASGHLDPRLEREVVRALLSDQAAQGENAETRLYGVMDLLARLAEGDVDQARLLVTSSRPRRCARRSQPNPGQLLGAIVEAGQRAGEFRPDSDPEAVGAVLVDAYVGVLVRWLGDEDEEEMRFPLRDAVHEICRIVVEGLRRRDASGAHAGNELNGESGGH